MNTTSGGHLDLLIKNSNFNGMVPFKFDATGILGILPPAGVSP